jgi:NADH:ubiquinone oxidoreductase subunit H
MKTNALFTFWTQCYSCEIWLDIYYTEFLTPFWFAMLVNEYRLETQFMKVCKVWNIIILEVTIARKVLPHPQGIKGSMHNLLSKGLFLWSRFARMRYEAGWFQWRRGPMFFGAKGSTSHPTPPPVDNFFSEKIFPDTNITIAFVAFFPILVALFSILQH